MQLTPRERFELTVRHQDVDRPVVDFQAAPEIIEALKNHFGVDDDELLDCLRVDVRHLGADYIGPPLRVFSDGSKEDMFGIRRKDIKAAAGTTSVETYNPLAEMKTIDDFRKGYSFPITELNLLFTPAEVCIK